MANPAGARRTPLAAVLVAVGVAVCVLAACSGCTGGSGPGTASSAATAGPRLADLPADQVLARTRAAAKAAGSVHVTGTQGGITLDLHVATDAATGTVTQDGLTAHLLRVGGRTYVKGDKAFWDATAAPGAGDVLAGKWVVAGGGGPDTSGLAQLTHLDTLLGLVLDPTGTVTVTGESTIEGRRVVGLRESGTAAVLYVAADGPPYPVTTRTPGATGAPPTFTGWGEPVVVPTPADDEVVDPSTLGG